jgi:hypothetical protein
MWLGTAEAERFTPGSRPAALTTDDLHQQYRDELWGAVSRAQRPETLKETAIRRLDSQLDRARRLFELGEYDEETFVLKRSAIRQE